MLSLPAFPFPNGGSRGGRSDVREPCALPAELGSFMVSLLASPLPNGGSRGARPEVCAMALAANAEANATAKTNFFTIFSVVFRCAGLKRSYHHSRPATAGVLLLFIAAAWVWRPADTKKSAGLLGPADRSRDRMRSALIRGTGSRADRRSRRSRTGRRSPGCSTERRGCSARQSGSACCRGCDA